jgi:purine nucleosidase
VAPPLPVVIDTDPGVDDALALLLAGAAAEVDVLAVTTVGGNVSLRRATENARRILPVAWSGRAAPSLHRGRTVAGATLEKVHGADGLGAVTSRKEEGGTLLYPSAVPVSAVAAPEAILSHAAARPGEITLIALGPLTNVAAALRRDRSRFRQLRRLVVMGGAFRVAGNATPVAEFNVFTDPEAAQAVCDSGVPQTWVPLDVTHRCVLRRDRLEALPDRPRTRFAQQITGLMMEHHALGYDELACFLHDPLAIGAVLWPELLRAFPLRIDVETGGEHTRGMTVADFRPPAYRACAPPNADVCLEVDAETFVARFLGLMLVENRRRKDVQALPTAS